MSRWFTRMSLVFMFLALLTTSSGTQPTGYCQSCPQARIDDHNYIRCLDGQEAWCKDGKCGCSGPAKKQNECGGECRVSNVAGACSVGCSNGVQATCIPGKRGWIGNSQTLTEPICKCGA